MKDSCQVCGMELSFRNSQYYEGRDVCKECYKGLISGEISLKSENQNTKEGPLVAASPVPQSLPHSTTTRVTVTDVDMPFVSMVSFMVKWVIASIPAIIILIILFGIVSAIFGGIFASLLR